MSGSVRKALPDVREVSGSGWETLLDVPEGWRPFRMSSSCQEALSDVGKALPVVQEWSKDPPECPGVVG